MRALEAWLTGAMKGRRRESYNLEIVHRHVEVDAEWLTGMGLAAIKDGNGGEFCDRVEKPDAVRAGGRVYAGRRKMKIIKL